LKTPTSYKTTLQGRALKNGNIIKGLKLHDYHMMMQYVLPFCLHTLMQEEFHMFLINLNCMFKILYAKVIDPNIMEMIRLKGLNTIKYAKKLVLKQISKIVFFQH